MVIWVFAGGGETELKGLKIFLERNYPRKFFQRQTPIRPKPGPRPDRPITQHALGKTRQGLAEQIRYQLNCAEPKIDCDLILVIDDLDCYQTGEITPLFTGAIDRCATATTKARLIGFAKPEIESWLVADWNNSFASDPDFRLYQVKIRRSLEKKYTNQVPAGDINTPEDFSFFDPQKGSCQMKLSGAIQQIVCDEAGINYSKDRHSGRMLQRIRAENVAERCPEFRKIHLILSHP